MNNHPTIIHDTNAPIEWVYVVTEDVFSAFTTLKAGTRVKLCGVHWNGRINEGPYGGLHETQSIHPCNEVLDNQRIIREVSMKRLKNVSM